MSTRLGRMLRLSALVHFLRRFDHSMAEQARGAVGRRPQVDLVMGAFARYGAATEVLLLLRFVAGNGSLAGLRLRAGGRILAAIAASIAAVGAVGSLVRRRRPFVRALPISTMLEPEPDRSFPSRHTACAVAMAVAAWPTDPATGRAMLGIAALLAAGRVYTRLHYPSDIVAGALVGLATGLALRSSPGNSAPARFADARLDRDRGERH